MPNIASVFKAEITRLARREVRESGEGLKKAVAGHRAEIAGLKRRIQTLEALVKRLSKGQIGSQTQDRIRASKEDAIRSGQRFNAKGMAANRKRLGLSAADFGLLIGTTGQSVYAWEAEKSKPRPQALTAIAALRGVGKREVAAKLASLKSQ